MSSDIELNFCQKPGDTQDETIGVIQKAFGDNIMSTSQIYIRVVKQLQR